MLNGVDRGKEGAIIREVARRYPRAKTKGKPGIVYRHGKVPEERVQTIRGVRVAPIIVVLFDVYRYYGRLACLVALESAWHRSPNLTQEKLLECARDLPRAKGARGSRQVIRESVAMSESALETVVRDMVRGIEGVITLEAQVQFDYVSEYGKRCTGRIDLVVNGIVAIERDGRAYHSDDAIGAERHREQTVTQSGDAAAARRMERG